MDINFKKLNMYIFSIMKHPVYINSTSRLLFLSLFIVTIIIVSPSPYPTHPGLLILPHLMQHTPRPLNPHKFTHFLQAKLTVRYYHCPQNIMTLGQYFNTRSLLNFQDYLKVYDSHNSVIYRLINNTNQIFFKLIKTLSFKMLEFLT